MNTKMLDGNSGSVTPNSTYVQVLGFRAVAEGLNKYRLHDRTTAQHDGTVGRGVRVPSCCAVAGRIPFAACMKTTSKANLCKIAKYFTIDMGST